MFCAASPTRSILTIKEKYVTMFRYHCVYKISPWQLTNDVVLTYHLVHSSDRTFVIIERRSKNKRDYLFCPQLKDFFELCPSYLSLVNDNSPVWILFSTQRLFCFSQSTKDYHNNKSWTNTPIALMHGGGLRNSITNERSGGISVSLGVTIGNRYILAIPRKYESQNTIG